MIITVDYGRTLEEMLAAARFEHLDVDLLPTDYPLQGTGVKRYACRLFPTDHRVSTTKAARGITTPWQPNRIEHLLAFAATFPGEQVKGPIVGVGSPMRAPDVGTYIPYLGMTDDRRLGFFLRLLCDFLFVDLTRWGPQYRFLGIRELPAAA